MQRKKREKSLLGDVFCVEKKKGESMGDLLARVRVEFSFQTDEKITYAGRLDPLARGLTLLLKNNARFEKEYYLSLPKTYEFEVILGVLTDTLDVLGKITKLDNSSEPRDNKEVCEKLEKILPSLTGTRKQTYPSYSSKTVKGKPLFTYARNNIHVKRPTRDIYIDSIGLVSVNTVKKEDFISSVLSSIRLINGDFRQNEIEAEWKKQTPLLSDLITVIKCKVTCSSGTYVRVLATDIASLLGTCGIADNINRIALGEFTKPQIIV